MAAEICDHAPRVVRGMGIGRRSRRLTPVPCSPRSALPIAWHNFVISACVECTQARIGSHITRSQYTLGTSTAYDTGYRARPGAKNGCKAKNERWSWVSLFLCILSRSAYVACG